jgi:Domain of unknown function (DUF4412)
MKKCTLFVPVLVLCTVIGARADFIIKQSMERSGRTDEITYRFKGTKIRMDVGSSLTSITDTTSGDIVTLLHDKKVAMKRAGAQVKAGLHVMEKAAEAGRQKDADSDLKPTGKQETINGYPCEEYVTKPLQGMEMHVFFDKDFPNYQKIVSMFGNLRGALGLSATGSGLLGAPEKYPGMLIRTESDVAGHKMTTTLVSVEQTDVPDSDFAIPSDYPVQEMKMPAIPAKPGEG